MARTSRRSAPPRTAPAVPDLDPVIHQRVRLGIGIAPQHRCGTAPLTPIESGHAASQRVRRLHAAEPRVPLLVLSGNQEPAMIEQALAIRRAKLEAGDWRTQHTTVLQGAILAARGDRAGAQELIGPALASLEDELGENHWRTQDAKMRADRWLTE